MKRRRWITVAVLAGLLILAWVGRRHWSREPTYQGKRFSQWLRQCETSHTESDEHEQAVQALRAQGEYAVRFLVAECFKAPSPLAAGYIRLRNVLPAAIREELPDPSESLQHQWQRADMLLREVRPPANVLLPVLAEPLKSTNHPGYRQAIYLLGATGSGGEEVAPFLVSALKSPDRRTRRHAASSLVGIGPAAGAAVPELIAALQDNAIQTWAIKALGNVGADAKAAIPHLQPMLARTNLEAAVALHKIDPNETEAFALLRGLLHSPPDAVPQEQVVQALPTRPLVTRSAPDLRKQAVWSLGNLGPLAHKAVSDLLELVRDPDFDTWNGAINALHYISPCNTNAIPLLLTKMKGNDLDQIMAATHLLRIDPGEAHAIAALIRLVEKGTNVDRASLIARLAEAGTNAMPAVPTLKELRNSLNKRERVAAARALDKIEGQSTSPR